MIFSKENVGRSGTTFIHTGSKIIGDKAGGVVTEQPIIVSNVPISADEITLMTSSQRAAVEKKVGFTNEVFAEDEINKKRKVKKEYDNV